jgi:structural maintenance of chromosome 4
VDGPEQADIDAATSERDALAKKAETLRPQIKDAEEMFSTLRKEYKSKVLFNFIIIGHRLIP